MKKALLAAAALVALPVMAQAQTPAPGFYIGAEGGLNWLLNFNATHILRAESALPRRRAGRLVA